LSTQACREDWSANIGLTNDRFTSHVRSPVGTEPGAPTERARAWETRRKFASWRWEALRTTFWLVPTVLVVVAALLFAITFAIDWAAYYGHLSLPFWNADGER